MINHNGYKCKIDRSSLTGNYIISLPPQDDSDLVDLLINNNDIYEGRLWEVLLKTSAKKLELNLSEVYFEPEGSVFVAYTDNYELAKEIEVILNKLTSNFEYLNDILNQSELNRGN